MRYLPTASLSVSQNAFRNIHPISFFETTLEKNTYIESKDRKSGLNVPIQVFFGLSDSRIESGDKNETFSDKCILNWHNWMF